MDAYDQAKAEYEQTIATNYYFDFSNPNCRKFYKDAALSAGKRGLEMGIRQAVGFIAVELWFSVVDSIGESDKTFEGTCKAVSLGLENGVKKIQNDYKSLFVHFGEGVVSGILASITTTIINTFFTTAENAGRIIRQTSASVVEAASILFFNTREQYLCDRMTSAAKVIATGASVVVGTLIQEEVSTKLETIPINSSLKKVVSTFAGSLCTGFLSVSLLFLIDNGPYTKLLIKVYGEGNRRLEEQAVLFKRYCAELESIEYERLDKETSYIYALSEKLQVTSEPDEINGFLRAAISELGLPSVFGESTIEEKMNDKNWILRF